ncbi:MAG TPA: hypothetical protein PK542_10790 [Treponemataceae bacterium]|nr:hypothetical protein [Treponemataceae bacterium]HPS44964.1 hypothetical protein [Treponemataceae bacterium]
MTILALNDIIRKENFIYYRREFTANALIELPGHQGVSQIEFTIETEPTGRKDIRVHLIDSIDYPLLPIVKQLKEYILGLDHEGRLP